MKKEMFIHDRRFQKDRRNADRPEVRRVQGPTRRVTPRKSGVASAWATVMPATGAAIRCRIMNESRRGVLLETTAAAIPCPVVVGETYWVNLKPSMAKRPVWAAGTVRHCREISPGSGIYRFGVFVSQGAPPELGNIPEP